HVFSRLTNHKYDSSNRDVSSRTWNPKLYPGSQSGRWNQLLKASALDVDAALSAASYGAFQILGSNFAVCGYQTVWDFVYAQAQTEREQLLAFMDFCNGNKLTPALKAGNWAAFARGYNGPAYAENQYDKKLAAAYAKRRK
ncbi:MAG: N-acetylmuramidase family protein, partial [Cytophagaceae bacterium]